MANGLIVAHLPSVVAEKYRARGFGLGGGKRRARVRGRGGVLSKTYRLEKDV